MIDPWIHELARERRCDRIAEAERDRLGRVAREREAGPPVWLRSLRDLRRRAPARVDADGAPPRESSPSTRRCERCPGT